MEHIWFEGIPWDGHHEYYRSTDDYTWVTDKDWKRFLRPVTYVSDWYAGHGGDEYGNCTLYLRTPFFSVVWRYPSFHRQTDVEIMEHSEYKMVEWFIRVHEGRDAWLEHVKVREAGCDTPIHHPAMCRCYVKKLTSERNNRG